MLSVALVAIIAHTNYLMHRIDVMRIACYRFLSKYGYVNVCVCEMRCAFKCWIHYSLLVFLKIVFALLYFTYIKSYFV